MRVLSATGIEELDRELANVLPQHGITVVGDCYSRLVLTKVARELEADTVIISPLLKNGENDLVQVIVNLRDKGIRVIVLPGNPEIPKTQELIKKLVPYGVYDYVYDKVGIKNIIERLIKPAALGDIPKHLIDAAAMQRAGDQISEEIKRQLPEDGQEIGGIKKKVFGLVKTLKELEPANKATFRVPDDFVAIGSIPGTQCCSGIGKAAEASPVAVLVPASAEACRVIKDIRREPALSHVPVVVVGRADEEACYRAGADECEPSLDDEAVARVRARAGRMRELREKASRDDLTSLYKRNSLNEYLIELERRSRETGAPFSLMMADLDHFKKVNDNYGHQAGDAVLKQFAQFLQDGVRRVDFAARYGGEEFLIVFPGAGAKEACMAGGKLRKLWEKQYIRLPSGEKIHCTFSAGVAGFSKSTPDIEALIGAADRALYQAKENGRNQVLEAREDGPPGYRQGNSHKGDRLEQLFRDSGSDMAAYLSRSGYNKYLVKEMLGSFCHIFSGKEVTIADIEVRPQVISGSTNSCPLLRLTKYVALLPAGEDLVILGRDGKFSKKILDGGW